MTFDDDAQLGRGRVRRGGGGRTGLAIGGGGGVLVVIALFVISQVTGVDLTGLVGGGAGTGTGSDQGQPLTQCSTGADANRDLDCRIEGAVESLDAFWAKQDVGYTQPDVLLFTDSVNTGCGSATSAVGPFYCPPDATVYLDTSFYAELRDRFGSSGGPLAQQYVVAHEFGHHIQNLLGTTDGLDTSGTGPQSNSVRLELQADCYAGAWAGGAATTVDANGTPYLEPITDSQLQDALSAASAVGDDRIQAGSGGGVQPDTWTHGSSEQRQNWFSTGYAKGWKACDTFTPSSV